MILLLEYTEQNPILEIKEISGKLNTSYNAVTNGVKSLLNFLLKGSDGNFEYKKLFLVSMIPTFLALDSLEMAVIILIFMKNYTASTAA